MIFITLISLITSVLLFIQNRKMSKVIDSYIKVGTESLKIQKEQGEFINQLQSFIGKIARSPDRS